MDPVVLAALIGSVPISVGTLLTWKNSRKSRNILEGNGRGDVVKMLKTIQDTQTHHGETLISILAWQVTHEQEHKQEVGS